MPEQPRRRLTYANVMSTLAVFVALGGSSYAAVKVNGRNITGQSIHASKLKRNTLTGLQIKEATLGRVPRAQHADSSGSAGSLDGVSAADLKIRCPLDTFPIADVCVERTPRRPVAYGSAVLECNFASGPSGPGRRLPTHGELMAALGAFQLAAGGELTSELIPSTARSGRVDVLYVIDESGGIAVTSDVSDGAKSFRCVLDPYN